MVDDTTHIDLTSICGIHATEFNYHLPSRSWCSLYVFTITVANQSGNVGERDTQIFQGAHTPPEVIKALRTSPSAPADNFTYLLTMVMYKHSDYLDCIIMFTPHKLSSAAAQCHECMYFVADKL